jgi:hypothetical protein
MAVITSNRPYIYRSYSSTIEGCLQEKCHGIS